MKPILQRENLWINVRFLNQSADQPTLLTIVANYNTDMTFDIELAYRVLFGIFFNFIDKLQHSQLLNVRQINHSRRMTQLTLQQSAHSVPNMD